jgi:hypothetical protein
MGQRLLRAAASVKPSRSHLMMGGGSIAGLFQPCPEAIAVDTVRAALTSGITSFDTAPHYGLGVSEERIGMGMSALGNELCSPAMRDAASDRAIRELKELGAVQLWTKSGRIICAAGTPGAVLQAGGTDITGVTYYDLLTNASRERDQIFDYTAEGAARSLDASEARSATAWRACACTTPTRTSWWTIAWRRAACWRGCERSGRRGASTASAWA